MIPVIYKYNFVPESAHLNFIRDFREAFGDDGMCAFELINKAANAWQGLTDEEKLQFEREQYLADYNAQCERVERGESPGLLWAKKKKAFRKLALRGQSRYFEESKVVGMQWGIFKEDEAAIEQDEKRRRSKLIPAYLPYSTFSSKSVLRSGKPQNKKARLDLDTDGRDTTVDCGE